MFSAGKLSVTLEDILVKVKEIDILSYYLNVTRIPTFINSPLREDKRPSFGLYSSDGKRIYFTDLSTGDRGGLFDLLGRMWGCKYIEVLERIYKDIPNMGSSISIEACTNYTIKSQKSVSKTDLKVKIRPWRDYDLEYWSSYGISKEWLVYAEVYPVSQIFIIKGEDTYIYPADKFAYAYVEHKEGKVTLKVYQPKSDPNHKWYNKHDKSVISLWTKVPKEEDRICICSSVKDALCLWSNTGIPSIAVQGEGYNMSETAINELRRRFKKIYVLFDNDTVGIADGQKFSSNTGFINVVLPKFEGGKDISDYYKVINNKELFKAEMLKLFT